MIRIDRQRAASDLLPAISRFFDVSAQKIRSIEDTWRPEAGSPVFTVEGVYRSRGWTEWTQGFQFGAPLLQFDATGDFNFLEIGRSHTLERMAPHLTHVGVHDHGFNNVSTYGNLWRLAREGRFEAEAWELRFYALALKVTGAVQARRWTPIPGGGFIYSFNGAHSLFVDTIRTLRALALSHVLGHRLLEEQDAHINLLERLLQHARATAEFGVYLGKERDTYDVRGRTAHESLFNAANGTYRGPSSQQGYSPFSTWTRGLAWAMLGFAEQLEFLQTIDPVELARTGTGTGTGTLEPQGSTLGEALRTPAFWIFAIGAALYGLVASGVGLFNESILAERGLGPNVYYQTLVVTAITGLAGNFIGGWLARFMPLNRLMAVSLSVLAAGLLALPHITTVAMAMAWAVMMGLGGGLVMVLFFSVWPRIFGRRHLGRIQGVAQAMTVLASAVGPLLLAWCVEMTGSYSAMFYVLAVTVGAVGAGAMFVRLPEGQG